MGDREANMATNAEKEKPKAGRNPVRALLRRGRRAGQALVEFAIVAPLMVTLLLFSIYFYEINHVRLKVQEMARFAAWEATGYPLHDYKERRQSGYFNRAKTAIAADALARFSNLKSTDRRSGTRYLAVGWNDPRFQIRDEQEPRIPSGNNSIINLNTIFSLVGYLVDIYSALSFRHLNPTLSAMMVGYWSEQIRFFGARYNRFNPPARWGFNKRGYPHVTVSLRFQNLFIPRRYMDRVGGWFSNKHYMARRFMFRERAALVADSWRMHYGESVTNQSTDSAFYKAVDRMAFVTPSIKNGLRALVVTPIQILVATMSGGGVIAPPLTMDPLKTALVSKQYKGRRPDSGKIRLVEDVGPRSYDTAPMKPQSEYVSTFQNRGEFHMGCHEPERLTCGPGLSTNNPFGDYVVPPPE